MFAKLTSHRFFVPLLFAAIKLVLHLYTNAFAGYGFFRDELYYIVSTDHLEAGYVDHPPLSIWILAVSRLMLGDSLFAIRLLPALAGAASMFIAGLLTIELGGNRSAQTLACLAFLVSPIFLAMNTFYSMNAFDILFWSISFLVLLRIVRAVSDGEGSIGTNRYWYILGGVLGLGLLNKTGVLWLGFGIALALIATPLRHHLRTKGPWAAAAIALLLFSPYVIWNAQNDWAHLEFINNASTQKYFGLSPMVFVVGQFLANNPVTVPLWIAGLVSLLMDPHSLRRAPGFVFLGAFFVLLLNGTSKPEYLAPAFPMLFAAGAARLEGVISGIGRMLTRRIYPVVLALGIIFAPATLPLLPVESYLSFADLLGIKPTTAESKQLAELPQFYADMFGWPELADRVTEAYRSLPDSEQTSAMIFGRNYGEASAVIFLGSENRLPPVFSGHNSFYLWGSEALRDTVWNAPPKVLIMIGGDADDHRRVFESVEHVKTHRVRYAMPYENDLPIYVCRGWKVPIREAWKSAKNYS